MSRLLLVSVLWLAACLPAQTVFLEVKDLKPGMRGVGKTVFSGDRIDDFQVEILGVLENIGPKQSLILARLSGGPLASTGVLQGMSGSPVYIDGKLIGAVAMAFPFAKEPIAGIRPIGEMLRVGAEPAPDSSKRLRASLFDKDLTGVFGGRQEALAGGAKMVDIATPVSFGGFTPATIEQFAPQLRKLGLEPLQGMAGGGSGSTRMGDPSRIKPGSMISVQLMNGDCNMSADGTVTYIDGNMIYAFGHRFLSVGTTALPFARSEVLTLLPVLTTSFKIFGRARAARHHLAGPQHGHCGRARQARGNGAGFYLGLPCRTQVRELPHGDRKRPISVSVAGADGGLLGHRRHGAIRRRFQLSCNR